MSQKSNNLTEHELNQKRWNHPLLTMEQAGRYQEIKQGEYHKINKNPKKYITTARLGFKYFKLRDNCQQNSVNLHEHPISVKSSGATPEKTADTNILSREYGECYNCGETTLVSSVGNHFQCNSCGSMWDEIEDNSQDSSRPKLEKGNEGSSIRSNTHPDILIESSWIKNKDGYLEMI